jgi:two-component system sensor histidine kinase ChvG
MDEIGDLSRAMAELSRRLQERIESIRSLSSDISHELKNPLASIRSAAEILPKTSESPDRERFVRIIQLEVSRLERLISSLREVTTIDAGMEDENREIIDLDVFVRRFIQDFRLRFPDHRIALEHSGSSARIRVNTERLEQALENLLVNACEFSDPGSAVSIFLDGDNGSVFMKICDEGPGIAPENLPRVFHRFFSHRPGEKRTGNNHMGLGLAIVKAIIEAHGGNVYAGNLPEGGAWFELRLPRAGSRY